MMTIFIIIKTHHHGMRDLAHLDDKGSLLLDCALKCARGDDGDAASSLVDDAL
jgi:hypothetical protein